MSRRPARTLARVDARQRANAALCGVAMTEWLALPRARRRALLAAARQAASPPVTRAGDNTPTPPCSATSIGPDSDMDKPR